MSDLLSPLVKKYIGSFVRAGLQALGGYLISQGIVTDADWAASVPGLVLLFSGLLWSLWEKRDSLIKLFTGMAMKGGVTLKQVDTEIAMGGGASRATGATETPRLK
jgi:hypothetical protein